MNDEEQSIPDDVPPVSVVPMFPLSAVFLYPGTVLPLRIFEPRYVQMIEDLLDGPGRFVLSMVRPGHESEMPGSPPVHPVGGLGEIGRHERLPGGEFLIFVVGLRRVNLEEIDSDRLYRRVKATPLDEKQPADEVIDELKPQLVDALRPRLEETRNQMRLKISGATGELPLHELPVSQLADLLMLQMSLPQERMLELYSQPDIESRARECLVESERHPPEEGGGGRLGDYLPG